MWPGSCVPLAGASRAEYREFTSLGFIRSGEHNVEVNEVGLDKAPPPIPYGAVRRTVISLVGPDPSTGDTHPRPIIWSPQPTP